ncbi:MAG: hypothetical protein ACK4K3_07525 [Aquabacterium sp.]
MNAASVLSQLKSPIGKLAARTAAELLLASPEVDNPKFLRAFTTFDTIIQLHASLSKLGLESKARTFILEPMVEVLRVQIREAVPVDQVAEDSAAYTCFIVAMSGLKQDEVKALREKAEALQD